MKKYTKILSLICALVLSFSFLTVISVAGGTGTQTDPFIITTAQELQNINNNVTAHYILGNNIDLADMDFTPIGNADSGAFSGSFNGNGYKISNLNVFSGKYAGLFGSNEGVVENVILEDIYVYGTRYVGGVVGQNTTYGTVENCKVISGLVESDGGMNNVNIGGVCGINNGAFIGPFSNGAGIDAKTEDVRIYGGGLLGYTSESIDIEGSHNTGKVSSYTASADYSFSGGLVGFAENILNVSESYNTGSVFCYATSSAQVYSGGFVSWAKELYIDNCRNIGDVSATKKKRYNSFDSSRPADACAGGFVGRTVNPSIIKNSFNKGNVQSDLSGGLISYGYGDVTISGCYNTGNITTYEWTFSSVGGLIGRCNGTSTIIYSYNTGRVYNTADTGGLVGRATSKVTITNSYNTGNISANYGAVGGLVGRATSNATITNSYNTGNISASGNAGGLVGYVSAQLDESNSYFLKTCRINGRDGYYGTVLNSENMKTQSSYNGWDFAEIWSMGGSINNGYPVLKSVNSPLTLNIGNKTMVIGEKVQLTAYKNGVATSDVTWSVSDGNSIVNTNGLVTAGPGLSTITATDNEGNKANLNIYGYTPAVSVTATNRTITMSEIGTENTPYITILGSDTDYIVDYQSSDTSVVEVDEVSGALTPVSVGTATITITTMGGATATQTVTVTAVAKSLSLPSTLTVARGSTKKITATTTPNPTSSVITWESSDPSVATVDSEGNVTGLKCGTTIITATTDNGYSDICTVTVNAPLTEMAFETPSLTLYVGQEYKLRLNINPTNTTDTITYSTSSSTYASVTSAGTVTAKKAGTATITATSSSGKKAYCVVTVKAWPSVFNLVDSTTSITENIITTDTTGVRNLEKLITVKDGYNIEVTYSHQLNGLNYCGTGTTIDVYDDYGNFVITYTLVVNGDVNGDSFVDVLDASNTERMATDALAFEEAQAYAANGTQIETIDASSYQYVLNKALAE